jgi:flagellar assembly protein FliH
VESVDALIQRMARERGFDGRIVTVGEPEIAFGDVRLEWADGGVVRDQTLIEQAVAQALGASDCHPGAPKASPGPITTAGDR